MMLGRWIWWWGCLFGCDHGWLDGCLMGTTQHPKWHSFREAEKSGFTSEDVQVELRHCKCIFQWWHCNICDARWQSTTAGRWTRSRGSPRTGEIWSRPWVLLFWHLKCSQFLWKSTSQELWICWSSWRTVWIDWPRWWLWRAMWVTRPRKTQLVRKLLRHLILLFIIIIVIIIIFIIIIWEMNFFRHDQQGRGEGGFEEAQGKHLGFRHWVCRGPAAEGDQDLCDFRLGKTQILDGRVTKN